MVLIILLLFYCPVMVFSVMVSLYSATRPIILLFLCVCRRTWVCARRVGCLGGVGCGLLSM